jgi:hypothetical protein
MRSRDPQNNRLTGGPTADEQRVAERLARRAERRRKQEHGRALEGERTRGGKRRRTPLNLPSERERQLGGER